jgi:CheY-like chemotaxis protein
MRTFIPLFCALISGREGQMNLTATAPAAEATINTATPTRAIAAPSFLVIDDDPVHRMVISRIGEKAGYTIIAVATAEAAAAEMKKQKFDCISLDLSLGGTNGALLLNDIATHNSQALLIVISGATAATREDTLVLALKLRLNVIEAPKPVDLANLRGKLLLHLATPKP